jgi:hypothetical protein
MLMIYNKTYPIVQHILFMSTEMSREKPDPVPIIPDPTASGSATLLLRKGGVRTHRRGLTRESNL